MACTGCRKNKQPTTRGTTTPPPSTPATDLTKFAYLTPKQLRLLEQQGKKPGDK